MTNANVNAADTRHYDGGSWAHILVTHTSPPTQQCQPMSLAGDGNGTSSTNQVWATASSPQMVQLSRRRTSGRTPEHPRPTTTTATRRAKGRHRRVPLCRPPPSNSEQLIVMAAYRQRRHPRLHTKSESPVGYRCPRWPGENSRSLIGIDALTRMAMGRRVPYLQGNASKISSSDRLPRAEKGRTGRQKGVECRPFQVTGGYCRTFENTP